MATIWYTGRIGYDAPTVKVSSVTVVISWVEIWGRTLRSFKRIESSPASNPPISAKVGWAASLVVVAKRKPSLKKNGAGATAGFAGACPHPFQTVLFNDQVGRDGVAVLIPCQNAAGG